MINTEAQIYFLLHYYRVKTEHMKYLPPESGLFARFHTTRRSFFTSVKPHYLAVLVTRLPGPFIREEPPRCFNFPQVIKCLQLQ